MPISDSELEERRWQYLRWAPRHDSGVLYHPDTAGEVWAKTIVDVVPFLASTGDFAPADMQYRMHRSALWSTATGLYGEAFDVDHGVWVREAPTAFTNSAVAAAMAEALRVGGDDTPAEMRGRWQRETRALIDAMRALDLDAESAELVAAAVLIATEDGWFPW